MKSTIDCMNHVEIDCSIKGTEKLEAKVKGLKLIQTSFPGLPSHHNFEAETADNVNEIYM